MAGSQKHGPSAAESSIAKMDAAARVQLAKKKIRKVVDRVSASHSLAEQNALIVYSSTLSSQIPRSFAANAFNVFQSAMHRYEIVQICAYWDKPDGLLTHNTIPTVCRLINDDRTLNILAEDVQSFWPMGTGDAIVARQRLKDLCNEAESVLRSSLLASVKNLRDKYLAHALDSTRAEMLGPVAPMKYGDERELMEKTSVIVEQLYLWITGANFDLEENRQMHRRHAKELWSNCRFDLSGH